MKFFDSCVYRVTPADVAADIASDLAHEKFLRTLGEVRAIERLERLAVTNHTNEKKETNHDEEAIGNR